MAGPRLLGRVRAAIRTRHYSYRTEQAYVYWVRRFIRFHGRRHPAEMGKAEVEAFLTDLAVRRKMSASTQTQALSAILFLYKAVLERELEWIDNVVRAKRRVREPVVLSADEVRAVLGHLREPYHLMVLLTTMVYTHVLERGGLGVRSPADTASGPSAVPPRR